MAVTLSIFDQFDTRRTSISGSTVGRKTRQFDLPEAPCSSPAWVCIRLPRQATYPTVRSPPPLERKRVRTALDSGNRSGTQLCDELNNQVRAN
jgi:hypothetical protein